MHTIEAVRRGGIAIEADGTIRDAAVLMEREGVGAIAVVDSGTLVGVVTDRDLVMRALARDVPGDARIDSAMSAPAIAIDAEADLHDAFALFRSHGVRRLAVTRGGEFVGMITVDDLLIDLTADLSDLARPVTAETIFGQHDATVPAVSSAAARP